MASDAEKAMTYKTIASALSAPADFDRIEKTANHYADGKFFVEIYKNGTCVFPPVSIEKAESGIKLLTALAEHQIDFIVKEMDDHNFVVRFTESVFSIVFTDEFTERQSEITQQAASAGEDEVLIGRPGAPQEHMLIGLYARTRLLEDIQKPSLIRSIVPTATSHIPK